MAGTKLGIFQFAVFATEDQMPLSTGVAVVAIFGEQRTATIIQLAPLVGMGAGKAGHEAAFLDSTEDAARDEQHKESRGPQLNGSAHCAG